jgi:hypothetical protein
MTAVNTSDGAALAGGLRKGAPTRKSVGARRCAGHRHLPKNRR